MTRHSRAWRNAGKKWGTGGTTGWHKTRAAVIARDGGRCQLRVDAECAGEAETAHHTVGRAKTGDDMAYLVAACNHCNYKVGDPSRGNPRPRTRTVFSGRHAS
jgi:5-methylcytosine-specific restriction endonuclease McrA